MEEHVESDNRPGTRRPRMNGQSHAPGNADTVHSAYSARAHEYIDLLGDIDTTAPEDRALVTRWARGCTGRVVDIGCGPGHWTAYLSDAGVTAEGIDPVPEFVDHAQRTYPQVQFRQGTFDDLGGLQDPLGGVFSWYSLIHLDPGDVPGALATMRASLAPGGRLLLAFFDGDKVEEFPHAVAPAFSWPLTTMIDTVDRAGFTVTHRERRHDPGHRPHAALLAYRD